MNEVNRSGHEEADDPLARERAKSFLQEEIEARSVEDPLIRFFAEQWQRILLVIFVGFAFYYAKNRFQETELASRRASADILTQVQSDFDMLEALSQNTADESMSKRRDEIRARLTQGIAALQDSKEPYSTAATFYGSLITSLTEGKAVNPSISSESFGGFASELNALKNARALLDSDREKAFAELIKLGSSAEFVNVSAASVLARIAISDEERSAVAGLIRSILEREPSQSTLLEADLERLQ